LSCVDVVAGAANNGSKWVCDLIEGQPSKFERVPQKFPGFSPHFGTGDAFVKSASYLMHRANFSDVRSFLRLSTLV